MSGLSFFTCSSGFAVEFGVRLMLWSPDYIGHHLDLSKESLVFGLNFFPQYLIDFFFFPLENLPLNFILDVKYHCQ